MLKSKIQYILTWVALGILLICGVLLIIVSWNGIITDAPSPTQMVILWTLISASGIYLFMFAVKKAHRQLVDEERNMADMELDQKDRASIKKDVKKDGQKMDFTSMAKKLVRRTEGSTSLDEISKGLMKTLASELEIMSGVFYIRTKAVFKSSNSYALSALTEPYTFKEGEGLTGQAAKNKQIMVLTRLPEEVMEVYSGLGKSKPTYLAIVPLVHKNRTVAVLECSGYKYDPQDIESMFRIFSRELMKNLSPNLS